MSTFSLWIFFTPQDRMNAHSPKERSVKKHTPEKCKHARAHTHTHAHAHTQKHSLTHDRHTHAHTTHIKNVIFLHILKAQERGRESSGTDITYSSSEVRAEPSAPISNFVVEVNADSTSQVCSESCEATT